jgi:hypothetical protein
MPEYSDADEWRAAVMERPDGVGADEQQLRREMAERHYAKAGEKPDKDALADHELYIRGKMDIEEYQAYLLFKHGRNSTDA